MLNRNAIIIAAHAGTGKSMFARKNPEIAVDLTYYCYRYNVPDAHKFDEKSSESVKAEFKYPKNEEYPENYLKALKAVLCEKKFILIPPDPAILLKLQLEDIPYVLVYPQLDAKEEYGRRFVARGNGESFMRIFVGKWHFFICDFLRDTYGKHIVMQSEQYLSDILGKEILDKGIGKIGIDNSWRVYSEDDYDISADGQISISADYDEIGENTFGLCDETKTVDIAEGVQCIAGSAFFCCENLTEVALPKSLKIISQSAFSRCIALRKVTLGSGIKGIERYAFAYCENLVKIEIPDSLESIDEGAFFGCRRLTVVYKGIEYNAICDGKNNEFCDIDSKFYKAVNGGFR